MSERRAVIKGVRDKTFHDDKLTLEDCVRCTVTGDRVTLVNCKDCTITGDKCKLINCKKCRVSGDGCIMENSSMCTSSGNRSVSVQRGVATQQSGGIVNNFFGRDIAVVGRSTTSTNPPLRLVLPPRTVGRTSFGSVQIGRASAGNSVTTNDGENVFVVDRRGTFINDIQVPEGTRLSQRTLFYKDRKVTAADERLFEEYPSLKLALESIRS